MVRSGPHSESRAIVAVLTLATFASVVHWGILSPLLPAISADLGVSVARAGQLTTITSIVSMLTALIASPWMDRFPRVYWLRAQCGLLLLSALLSATAADVAWLTAGRMLGGLGHVLVMATCFAAAADAFPDPARRNRAVGVIVSAATIAILAGLPVVAQIEDRAGWRWALTLPVLPLILVLAATWWMRLPDAPPGDPGRPRQGLATRYGQVLHHPAALWLLATLAVLMLVYVGWLTYFGAYAEEGLRVGATTLGTLFLVAGLAELLGNNATPLAMERWTPARVFQVTMAAFAVSLLLTGIDGLWAAYILVTLLSVSSATAYIVVYTLLLDALPNARGTIAALGAAAANLGSTLGATLGGVALAAFDDYAMVYRLFGLVTLAGLVTFARHARHRRAAVVETPALSRAES